ncbi:MAG: hypothetical protein EA392_03090 [Cryomorphaceae bacterium]|nr:MAG: hypothetical protein EA392_03090 [Cryomorphaceae bacterium]
MDIQTRKINFVQEFLRLQNEELISALEALLREKKALGYEQNLKPMSEQQLNDDIDQSLKDAETGKHLSAKQLKSKAKRWG